MDSDNQERTYCADDGEYSVYCHISDILCKERFYKNHLKSQSHTNKVYRRQRINNTNKSN